MPEIIVDFVPDYSKLETGISKLADSGVISKEVANLFKGAQKPIDDFQKKLGTGSKAISKDLDTVRKQVQGIAKSMNEGFKEGIADALKEAGVSVEEFEAALKELMGTEKSLKQQLKETKEELALMKLEGKENTAEYQKLIEKAGQLADTLSDVAAETRRVGSDTRRIDTVIEVVQGLGAAYQVAQGAAALLGDENEDMQKGLLRLQAIMSITMGIQQIMNLLQKESNAIRFITNLQLKAQVAATNLQTAAQSRSIIVNGLATAGWRVLNLVMKANPAFLLISAFAALTGVLALFGRRSKAAADEAALLTAEIERQNRALQDSIAAIDLRTRIRLANAKREGASEGELANITLAGIVKQKIAYTKTLLERQEQAKKFYTAEGTRVDVMVKNYTDAAREINSVDKKLAEDLSKKERKKFENTKTFLVSLAESYKNVADAQNSLNLQIAENGAEAAERKRNAEKAAADKAKKDAEELAQKLRDIELQRLTDVKADIEKRLTAVKEGGQRQLDLQVALADAEKNIGIFNAKSLAEKELAIANFLKKVDDLTTAFYLNDSKKQIEAQASVLNAQLQNINIGFEERERLTVELLEKQRALELLEVTGNKEKEMEINAKFDLQIAQQRLEIRKQAFDQEMRLETANGGVRRRQLQELADDERVSAEVRKAVINDLLNIELDGIDKKMQANEQYFNDGLISQQEYNTVVAELTDEAALAHENAEKKKTAITTEETEKRKQKAKEELLEVLNAAAQITDALANISDVISQRQQNTLDLQRQQLEDMREGGTLTEREFNERMRRLDVADRNAKRKAAEREKSIQLFQAFIAGARAIIEAAPDPFKIAFTALLVGAQIAAIAARPIPKFGKGTKSAPKGFAEVGETGTELIHTGGGKYFVADHPQIIWMKGGERIYNPMETQAIMTPAADRKLTDRQFALNGGSAMGINEESLAKKIGAEIAKHPRNVFNIDEDGFTHHIQKELYQQLLRNKQYTFHD